MKFQINIESENQSMVDDTRFEVSGILKSISRQIREGSDGGNCRDMNGNTVGSWFLEKSAGTDYLDSAIDYVKESMSRSDIICELGDNHLIYDECRTSELREMLVDRLEDDALCDVKQFCDSYNVYTGA